MKILTLNTRKVEILVYALIWMLVFSVLLFSERDFNNLNRHRLLNEWIHLLGCLVVFIVNVYYLVPQLLFKKKYLAYFSAILTAILLVTGIGILMNVNGPHNEIIRQGFDHGPSINAHKPLFAVVVDNVILILLIVGAGTASKLVTKWLSEEKLRKDIEKEQLITSLALLRHQVSPHFFMNTLNNIHALIDINTEDAKDSIIRMSTLMRYLLYDSAQANIKLRKEIEFINSFVALMKLRFSDKVDITVVVPEQIPEVQIPPMLFISFLENAFKHGISYQAKSFVYFEIGLIGKTLRCVIRNSKHQQEASPYGEYSGIGLENIKKSLALLYEENYQLTITDGAHDFEVDLSIPI